MKRITLPIAVLLLSFSILTFALPAFAGTNIIDGTLTTANLLPNGKPNSSDCVSNDLDNYYAPLYYQLRQFTVTADGVYKYYDIGFRDDNDTYGTIDIEIALYTGSPSGFDPADPRGNGCFFNADDERPVQLMAGVVYTILITSNDNDPNTGYYIFSLNGPGDVVFIQPGDCSNPLPTNAVQHNIPAGAPAFFAPDLGSQTNFNIPAGTWWTYGASGDFTHVWVACEANSVWVPSNAVAP
ncbi:MAG: hypothetical protein U0670_07090 [Anaerolineae bacterium]